MGNYIVSARKYRPSTFRSVVGQGVLTATLKNAIATNHLAHAYLFCGPRGVGKTTCARIFAKTINCFHPTADGEACNECESCRGFNEQRSFNVHELDAASNNSVEDIRSLIEKVRVPPQVGKYGVYIIDEVHMLSSSAFNAFLKTLEEPPSHAVFVLATTEKHRVLPTILSRCQIYDFNRIGVNDTVEYLQYVALQEGITAESQALGVIAQKADGGMRDALSIFDQVVSFCGSNITYKEVIQNLNVLDYEYYFRFIELFKEGNIPQSLLGFDEILNKGFDGQNFVQGLAVHFRNLLTATDAATVDLMEVAQEVKERYIEQAKSATVAFLYNGLRLACECDLNYRQSKNKRLLVELMLIRMCQLVAPLDEESTEKKKDKIKPFTYTETKLPNGCTATHRHVDPSPMYRPPKDAPVVPRVPSVGAPIPVFAPREVPTRKSILEATPTQQEVAVSSSGRSTPFEERQLQKLWNEYAQRIEKNAKLSNAMKNFVPTCVEQNRYELLLVNPAQKKDIDQEMPQIRAYLADALQNDLFQIEVKVSKVVAEKLAFTPDEFWNKMCENNHELVEFKTKLMLEID